MAKKKIVLHYETTKVLNDVNKNSTLNYIGTRKSNELSKHIL